MKSKVIASLRSSVFLLVASVGWSGCSLIFQPELSEDVQMAGTCGTSADCASSGATFVCSPMGQCVNALTANCTTIAGAESLQEPGTVVFGSILPTEGDNAGIGRAIELAQNMAVSEINSSGGLPGPRDVAIVNCDSSGITAQGVSVADHLINNVGVPAILGPAFSGIYIEVTKDTVPADVLTISPSATSALITTLNDDGLAWRTAASDQFQGGAIAEMVRCRGFSTVAVLAKNDAYGRGLRDRVVEELASELNANSFAAATFDDPGENPAEDFQDEITSVLTTIGGGTPSVAPDVAIILGTTEVATIVELFETRTLALTGTTAVRYILADGGKLDAVRDLIRADANEVPPGDLQMRIEGTEPNHQNGSAYASFEGRYIVDAQNPDGARPGIFAANSYDSVYLLALAVSSLPTDTAITGPIIRDRMGRLVSGAEVVTPGPSNFQDAAMRLSNGNNVNYNGASGPLDFDLTTGEAGTNVARWQYEAFPSADGFRATNIGAFDVNAGTWSGVPGTSTCN